MDTTRRSLVILGIALALPSLAAAQTATNARARAVARDIDYLASDALAGRKTGSPGNDSAAAYLARELRRIGLRPAGDSGSFLQHWTVGNTSGTREAQVAGDPTENVVALLPGAGALAGEAIVIGAHFDHLGRGPFGSMTPDSAGQIHHGADDNASGTAAVVEIARRLARLPRPRNARAIVFVLFNGEEEGALGSGWYANHPLVSMDSTMAMLNFDMVGRLRNNRLIALGVRTAAEWPALLDSLNATAHFDLAASGDGWGPSDHASFTAKKRPVLFFFTDLHEDYHRPSDVAAKIDADGIVRIADFGAALAQNLRTRATPPTYVDVPPPAPVAAAAGPRPVLGTIPDMTDEPGGVRLSGVRSGSPAEAAGLAQGDVLTGMGDKPIANLQDFQNALTSHHGGDTVLVRFKRAGRDTSVTVILGGARPAN